MCKKEKPTCLDCQNVNLIKGFPATREEPGEDDMWDCKIATIRAEIGDETLMDLAEQLEWNEDILPEQCGCFKPEMIIHCENCTKEMNVPRWSWGIFAGTLLAEVPCCNEECKKVIEATVAQDIQEMKGKCLGESTPEPPFCEYCDEKNKENDFEGSDGVYYDSKKEKHFLVIHHFRNERNRVEVEYCPQCGRKF